MARGLFRKTSFNKMIGAYRSQWKRFWRRLFSFGVYGKKGIGWLRDPKKALYNRWYYRTSISIPRLLGYKPSTASFIGAMLIASVISLFASPVDATRAAVKAHKVKANRKARSKSSESTVSSSSRTNTERTAKSKSYSPASYKEDKPSASKAVSSSSHTYSYSEKFKPLTTSTTPDPNTIYTTADPVTPTPIAKATTAELGENTPKSKPKHAGDQYIRKRMIIAGSSYCDKSALNKLAIGTYFELVAEPTNPYDKDAIMLVHDGEKIGYIAKQDKMAFVTCLKLKRKVYGVITNIITEPYPTKYEYETWFDSEKN